MGWWSWLFGRAPAPDDDNGDDDDEGDGDDDGDPAAPALTDELDLHTFQPRECGDVVAEYLRAAQAAGFASVRIIHGKGRGALRRTVHAELARHPAVHGFALAGASRGGWGATLVELRAAEAGGSGDRRDEQDE